MVAEAANSASSWRQLKPRASRWMRGSLKVFASRTMFWVWIVLAVFVALGLLYSVVWLPLQEGVQAPAGVANTDPTINRELQQKLIDDLSVRRRHVPGSYFKVNSVFGLTQPASVSLPGEVDVEEE